MDEAAKMELRHWANLEQAYLRDFLRDQQCGKKVEEVQRERDAAIVERDAAIAEKQSANAERDSALLQRDIAYADRHAAWMERDNALAALSILQGNESNSENTAQLMHSVNTVVDSFPVESNLLDYQNPPSGMCSNHLEGKLPQARPKQQVQKAQKEMTVKQQENGAPSEVNEESEAPNPTKNGSKASRKRRRQLDALANGEKIKREDSMVSYVAPIDMSSTAVPFCSCTGIHRPCYRWGNGGWQSACCTNSISEYPLPMNQTKHGTRVAGRKMSIGAFKKLLERLAGEGVDITQPVDLKDHWAKHGTNRYIIVR